MTGYVYFIKAGECLKVGHSIDPKERFNEHRITERRTRPELLFLGCIPGTRADERHFHGKLREYREGDREWFRVGHDYDLKELIGDAQLILSPPSIFVRPAVSLAPELHRRLKVLAASKDMTLQQLLTEAAIEKLRGQKAA